MTLYKVLKKQELDYKCNVMELEESADTLREHGQVIDISAELERLHQEYVSDRRKTLEEHANESPILRDALAGETNVIEEYTCTRNTHKWSLFPKKDTSYEKNTCDLRKIVGGFYRETGKNHWPLSPAMIPAYALGAAYSFKVALLNAAEPGFLDLVAGMGTLPACLIAGMFALANALPGDETERAAYVQDAICEVYTHQESCSSTRESSGKVSMT